MARLSMDTPALFASLLCLAGLMVTGCASDFGETCDIPEAVEIGRACYPTGDDNAFCVYNQSEQCASRQCGTYLQSGSFCTEECEKDDDCPSEAFCQTLSGGGVSGYCVPRGFDETR